MTLVRSLFERELVDELRLLVYPVVLGTGKRLFGEQGRSTADAREGRVVRDRRRQSHLPPMSFGAGEVYNRHD